jgi:PilZ domain
MRMFVKLSSGGSAAFELSATINVSCHGACVETKQYWPADEQISVRSIRGNLFSRARVAYCKPQSQNAYVMGLDFQFPTGDWTRTP